MDSGIWPERLFLARYSSSSPVRFPMEAGISPESWLKSMYRIPNWCRFPIDSGMVSKASRSLVLKYVSISSTTRTLHDAETSFCLEVAVMTVSPALLAVTAPVDGSTAAMSGFSELHIRVGSEASAGSTDPCSVSPPPPNRQG